ncbi:hypothetical protein LINPERHAP2_LOCUS12569 [Linum perenne]
MIIRHWRDPEEILRGFVWRWTYQNLSSLNTGFDVGFGVLSMKVYISFVSTVAAMVIRTKLASKSRRRMLPRIRQRVFSIQCFRVLSSRMTALRLMRTLALGCKLRGIGGNRNLWRHRRRVYRRPGQREVKPKKEIASLFLQTRKILMLSLKFLPNQRRYRWSLMLMSH